MPRGPRGEKRPADVIGNAVRVMQIATGEVEDDPRDPAKQLAREGGLIGGRWLGGTNVHSAVHLARVRADNLGAEALAELHGKLGLARGGWSNNDDKRTRGWGRQR